MVYKRTIRAFVGKVGLENSGELSKLAGSFFDWPSDVFQNFSLHRHEYRIVAANGSYSQPNTGGPEASGSCVIYSSNSFQAPPHLLHPCYSQMIYRKYRFHSERLKTGTTRHGEGGDVGGAFRSLTARQTPGQNHLRPNRVSRKKNRMQRATAKRPGRPGGLLTMYTSGTML